MGIDVVKLRRHFGRHKVPKLLADLFRFAGKKDFFSGHLELTDSAGRDVAVETLAHLHKKAVKTYGEEARDQLALFASEGDGSSYALWFHDGQPSEAAPVVFICSEGTDSGVVTDNLAEFLALLRLDLDEVGRFYEVKRDRTEPHADAHEAYLRWADTHGVAPAPAKPKDLVKKARRKHPDFAVWFGALCEKSLALDAKVAKVAKRAASVPAPAPLPDLSSGVLALELAAVSERLGPALLAVVEAVRGRDAEMTLSSTIRLGLTETRKVDTHVSGELPPDIAAAVELRLVWKRGTASARTLILTPPRKGKKLWEAEFWMWPHPAADPAVAADRDVFEKALSAAGAVKVRRGNAAT